jgi:chaperonin GroES
MGKINITPLADRVIIRQAEAETTTASGIIIPDTAQEKPQKGSVIAVGKGTKDNPITVKAGDTVLYGKYAGTELKHEEEDYLIMKESDILAIIK